MSKKSAAVEDVTCSKCHESAQITPHPVEGHEQRWQCPHCGRVNVIDGAPGEPGEGALNPAATALTDDELIEAVRRKGLIHQVEVGGGASPAGEAS
jgi:transposase